MTPEIASALSSFSYVFIVVEGQFDLSRHMQSLECALVLGNLPIWASIGPCFAHSHTVLILQEWTYVISSVNS